MSHVLELLIIGMATQRLTVMWMQPNGLFESLRQRVMRVHALLAAGAACSLCVSMWLAFVLYGLWFVPYGQYVVEALAVASLASAANAWNRGG